MLLPSWQHTFCHSQICVLVKYVSCTNTPQVNTCANIMTISKFKQTEEERIFFNFQEKKSAITMATLFLLWSKMCLKQCTLKGKHLCQITWGTRYENACVWHQISEGHIFIKITLAMVISQFRFPLYWMHSISLE